MWLCKIRLSAVQWVRPGSRNVVCCSPHFSCRCVAVSSLHPLHRLRYRSCVLFDLYFFVRRRVFVFSFRLVQAAFDACSKQFGPLNGILSNSNDCIDLVTSTIAAKRVSGADYPTIRVGCGGGRNPGKRESVFKLPTRYPRGRASECVCAMIRQHCEPVPTLRRVRCMYMYDPVRVATHHRSICTTLCHSDWGPT